MGWDPQTHLHLLQVCTIPLPDPGLFGFYSLLLVSMDVIDELGRLCMAFILTCNHLLNEISYVPTLVNT